MITLAYDNLVKVVRFHLRGMRLDDTLSETELALCRMAVRYDVGPYDTACQIASDRSDAKDQ